MSRVPVVLLVLSVMFILAGCCLKHDYAEATCEEPRTCTKCGKTEGEALGHTYVNPTCEEPKTCTTCGKKVGNAAGHKYADATCDKPKTCSVCGKTKDSALGHAYQDATCTEAAVCTRCGTTEGKALGHDFRETSCTKPSKCSRCEETLPAAGHDFADASCKEPKTCRKCGQTEGSALGHKPENGKCVRCGLSLGSLDYIASFIGKTASVEDNVSKCLVRVNSDENPYDVYYDYGDEYNELIANCDWSLVFDAEYYKKTFPMLAMLYHNDDALLLTHFQTVGIHEGRQGSAKFNVGAYLLNCAGKVYKAFHREDVSSYECYYLYYMLNYDTEKEVNTVSANNGKSVPQQYKQVLTYVQKQELKAINEYRAEVNAEKVKADSELNAIANYRAYVNQTEGWHAHDWIKENTKIANQWMKAFGSKSLGENEVESKKSSVKICAELYYGSPEHYETMVDTRYKYVGMSNTYTGTVKNEKGHYSYSFDVYMTAADSSPLYR